MTCCDVLVSVREVNCCVRWFNTSARPSTSVKKWNITTTTNWTNWELYSKNLKKITSYNTCAGMSLPCTTPAQVCDYLVQHLRRYVITSYNTCAGTWLPCTTPAQVRDYLVQHLHRYVITSYNTCAGTWLPCTTPAQVRDYLVQHLRRYVITSYNTCAGTWLPRTTPAQVRAAWCVCFVVDFIMWTIVSFLLTVSDKCVLNCYTVLFSSSLFLITV